MRDEVKLEFQSIKETKRQLKLEGSMFPHKGHKPFRKHKVTGQVSEAVLVFQHFSYNHYLATGNALIQAKILDDGNYTYGTFLNLENASKKL